MKAPEFSRYLKVAAIAALITCISSSAGAAVLLQWNTFGNTGLETTEPSVFNDPGLTPSSLTQGAITPAGNTNRFGGTNWFDAGDSNPTTLAESVSGNDYIQFIVTPTAGTQSFTATSFTFSWDHSGTGPSGVALRSSADGFSTNLGSVTGLAAAITTTTFTFSVTSSTPITFRIYGFNATQTGGTGGFDVASNIVNVELDGTVTAVPEPATVLGGILGLCGLCWHQRRRLTSLVSHRQRNVISQ